MDEAVDWSAYFDSIRSQCPWSAPAWTQGGIEVCDWRGADLVPPLRRLRARVWVCDLAPAELEDQAVLLDRTDAQCEWFFSYPGYGAWATPVTVLIQQDRAALNRARGAAAPDLSNLPAAASEGK